jgi:hypothetical protein
MGAAAASILAFAVVLGIPWIQHTLSTVSTDDAYVNGSALGMRGYARAKVCWRSHCIGTGEARVGHAEQVVTSVEADLIQGGKLHILARLGGNRGKVI